MTPRAVDQLNVGLMLASLVAALLLPFELFLFAYAVLGPLHYLTEISWLSERRFFTRRKHDWILLAALVIAVVLGTRFVLGEFHVHALAEWASPLVFLAFAWALVLALVNSTLERMVGLLAMLVFTIAFHGVGARAWFLAALFLTTILHVCVFTGAFLLFGALRTRSRTGFFAFGMFAACCAATLLLPSSAGAPAGPYVSSSYTSFAGLNTELAKLFDLGSGSAGGNFRPFKNYSDLLTSAGGVTVMRLIAFAYTYHYLNWFSKTSIIGWLQVDKRKLAAALVVWIASLALYAIDYKLGARWLFLLSFAHVLFEFPLNHLSFVGIVRELKLVLPIGANGAGSREILQKNGDRR